MTEGLRDEAAAWVARLDADASEETARAFRVWAEADPAHAVQFARAKAMWLMLDDARAGGGSRSGADDELDKAPLFTRRRMFGGAAAVATLGISALFLPAQVSARRLATGIGQTAAYRLEDGTRLHLDTDTEAELRLSDRERQLRLIRGGAWLHVEPAAVPFEAVSEGLRLRARRADFSFHHGADDLVLVSAGSLDLSAAGDDKFEVELLAGTEAVRRAGVPIRLRSLPAGDIERRLRWREGRIEFDGEAVADAARMFNRYNRYRIIVADPQLARQTLVGSFSANEPRRFAQAVADAFDGKAVFGPDAATISLR